MYGDDRQTTAFVAGGPFMGRRLLARTIKRNVGVVAREKQASQKSACGPDEQKIQYLSALAQEDYMRGR
jgi:hypothetical protein